MRELSSNGSSNSGMSDGFQVSSSQSNSERDSDSDVVAIGGRARVDIYYDDFVAANSREDISDVVTLGGRARVDVYYDDFVTANIREDLLEPQEAGRDILENWEGVPGLDGRVGGNLPLVSSGNEVLAQFLSGDEGGDASFAGEVVAENDQELEFAPSFGQVKDNLSDHENEI